MRSQKAFTLVELLVVIGIIAVLIAVLLPALRKARLACQAAICASHLRQIGTGLMMYVNDNQGRFPLVVEPLWSGGAGPNFAADPFNFEQNPATLPATMRPYLKEADVYRCPSAVLGCPAPDPRMSYRTSAANNFDGLVKAEEELLNPDGSPQYPYSLKYLNGRKYRLWYVDANYLPFRLSKGVGPFYLARDFVNRSPTGQFNSPHGKNYNQLRLDLSVSFEKDTTIGFTYP